jgi:hypothetical protein
VPNPAARQPSAVLQSRDITSLLVMEESLKPGHSCECTYERDPYYGRWEQARILRQQRAAELDWDNLSTRSKTWLGAMLTQGKVIAHS